LRGVVVSDKAAKTVTVLVIRSSRHPKYGKMVRSKRRFHVHDEVRAAHVGDTVEIVECRPMSRTKRWRLERVLQRSLEQAVVSAPPLPADAAPAP
jgi:small subunit ribosomal protein S17